MQERGLIQTLLGLAATAALLVSTPTARAETTLRIVMHSDLKILDPTWTWAYISRNYGAMVYDTLFALDKDLKVQPQMVDTYTVSDDKLVYTFKLRDGLKFHDGAPVTANDVIASLKRWGARDSWGQQLLEFTKSLDVVDDKTVRLTLREPYALVLEALAKPGSLVPFIMPARVAADEQITDTIGSGPFIFKKDEWRPGNKAVFVKNPDYKPRSEPASGLAGGKVAKVDRIEWISMPDPQTAVNALLAGEIDVIESPQHDLLPLLEADKNIELRAASKRGQQYMLRFNFKFPPFNDERVRQAALASLSQINFLQAAVGSPKYYRTCQALFGCGTPLAEKVEGDFLLKSDFAASKNLLKEARYDGKPIVIYQATDVNSLNPLGPVAAQLLRKGGFNVDLQAMDWQTLIARRSKGQTMAPADGGWNIFLTTWAVEDIMNPIVSVALSGKCDKAYYGWPCDEKIDAMRLDFAKASDLAKQKKIAADIQSHAYKFGFYAPLGEWTGPSAWRRGHVGGVLEAPFLVQWNISKK
ncbi:MAG: ABC transporter substrate-binding protein [Hyphomicrobiaceae bacterium]|nr:MAG: ABC transporter substrate-binding protein [Hyphomicrobiaceae bacterium]